MPLVACPDCGSQVSTLAPACPTCGRPMAPLKTVGDTTLRRNRGCADLLIWGPLLLAATGAILFGIVKACGG
jgi:hypothetical protein